jgi:ComF family protein
MQRAERRAVFAARLKTLVCSFFAVVFPSDCKLCNTPLLNISRLPVCDECLAAIRPTRSPLCVLCGERLAPAQLLMGDGQCVHCRELPPEFARAVSFAEYEGGLRRLIHLLKYEGIRPAGPVLGEMLADAIIELLPSCADSRPVLVSVPLHGSKRRERGFNQAEAIARAAAKRLSPSLHVVSDALIRRRPTQSQVGLTREQRMENIRGAFRVVDASGIRGRNVIVVDDVMTTGTTLSECARTLKRAGAERVWAATVARTFHSARLTAASDQGERETVEEVELTASV